MKTSVLLSALLSFGILGLAAGFWVARSTQDARAATGGASDLSGVEERLAALEKGLEALGDLRSDIDALKRRAESRSEPVAAPAAPGAPEEEATVAVLVREEGEVPSTKLERWLDGQGMRGDFDDLVSKTYEKARTSRLARERAEQEERAKEMEALSQGPYGKYNYRVNSLAKKLGLDTRQETYVYNLLLKYEDLRRQEWEQNAQPEGEATPDRLKEHMDRMLKMNQELSQQYENELLAGLNPNQREIYEDLPEHERGGLDSVKMISYEGSPGMAATGAVRFSLPLGGVVEKLVAPPKTLAPVPVPAPPPRGK